MTNEKPMSGPNAPKPGIPVYVCDDCMLAVAWPAGVEIHQALRCAHNVPRSTTRTTWSSANCVVPYVAPEVCV